MLAADGAGRNWPREGSSALHRSAYERGLVAPRVHFVKCFRLEGADVEQELKLVAKVRSHHLGPVGGDRERDVAIDEGRHALAQGRLVREGPRQEVRGGADLENDARILYEPHGLLVSGGEDPVPDAVGAKVLQDLPDLRDAVCAAFLADMDGDAEPCSPRLFDERSQVAVRVAAAVGARTGDVDADDSALAVADRLLDDHLVLLAREGAVHHEDEACPDTRVLEARAVEPTDGSHDDVVEVTLAAAISFHRVEAELERRDVLRPVSAANGLVDGALDSERARLDQLRPLVDLIELGEAFDPARVDGDQVDELPVILDRKRDPLLVGERPHDCGIDRRSEMSVQLREPAARELLDDGSGVAHAASLKFRRAKPARRTRVHARRSPRKSRRPALVDSRDGCLADASRSGAGGLAVDAGGRDGQRRVSRPQDAKRGRGRSGARFRASHARRWRDCAPSLAARAAAGRSRLRLLYLTPLPRPGRGAGQAG